MTDLGLGHPEKPSQGVQGNDGGDKPTQTPTPGSKTMPWPTSDGKPCFGRINRNPV